MKKTVILATMIAASLAGCAATCVPVTTHDAQTGYSHTECVPAAPSDAYAANPTWSAPDTQEPEPDHANHAYDFPVASMLPWAQDIPTYATGDAVPIKWMAGPFASQAEADAAKKEIADQAALSKAQEHERGMSGAFDFCVGYELPDRLGIPTHMAHMCLTAGPFASQADADAAREKVHEYLTGTGDEAAIQKGERDAAAAAIARQDREENATYNAVKVFAYAEDNAGTSLLTHSRCPLPGYQGIAFMLRTDRYYRGRWMGCWKAKPDTQFGTGDFIEFNALLVDGKTGWKFAPQFGHSMRASEFVKGDPRRERAFE
ncbi:hypothetical protein [Paraburkholderia sp. BCC1876]|uniref:hypothetical protein n=1 Tax=Paraburkholderia sp. BCC1876 TaxID=2676303 RepID=UPI001590986F|nr:hypothetical protein [Paraburkholderia sp. BCC1876]